MERGFVVRTQNLKHRLGYETVQNVGNSEAPKVPFLPRFGYPNTTDHARLVGSIQQSLLESRK
jgi:hypothetical protein